MSFIADFFGAGGTGSSLVSSAGQIGLGLVKNDATRIQGDYQVQLAKLTNDATLTTEQFNLALNRLTKEREAALATYTDQKRNDMLTLVGIIGGLVAVVVVAVVLIRKPKPA
ncbi:hypothetical protein GCM10027578_22170 [Spirosoma luteolum]